MVHCIAHGSLQYQGIGGLPQGMLESLISIGFLALLTGTPCRYMSSTVLLKFWLYQLFKSSVYDLQTRQETQVQL